MKTWLNPHGRYPPHLWARPLREQVENQSFNLTSNLSESTHARIADLMAKTNTSLRNGPLLKWLQPKQWAFFSP